MQFDAWRTFPNTSSRGSMLHGLGNVRGLYYVLPDLSIYTKKVSTTERVILLSIIQTSISSQHIMRSYKKPAESYCTHMETVKHCVADAKSHSRQGPRCTMWDAHQSRSLDCLVLPHCQILPHTRCTVTGPCLTSYEHEEYKAFWCLVAPAPRWGSGTSAVCHCWL
jgi:hypothetical protein